MNATTPFVLIVGASRGIGLALTRHYIAQKRSVLACCRTPNKATDLQALAKETPLLRIETVDVDNPASINTLKKTLDGAAIDLLINTAGIFSGADSTATASNNDTTQRFGSIDPEGWLESFRTNTIGPILVAEALQKNLAIVPSKLIIIGSRMGSIAKIRREGDIAYRSSKAALHAAAKSISFSLAKQNTIVACVHPGWVRTDMGGTEGDMSPEESALSLASVIKTLSPDQTGQFFNYDGQILPW